MRLTYTKIIERLTETHGNKYSYVKVPKTVTRKSSLPVVCSAHGQFNVLFHDHYYNKSGCPSCAHDKKQKTQHTFIEQAIEVHGDKYDYSSVNYKNNYSKVKIICKTHGEFKQVPYSHTNYKNGCPKCNFDAHRTTNQEFIEKANKIHNKQYDYSMVNYRHVHKYVTIICKKHGEFGQTPSNHLYNKSGCPMCADHTKYSYKYFERYPQNKTLKGILYIAEISNNDEKFIKIGITKHKNFYKRYEQEGYIDKYDVKLIDKFSMCLFEAYNLEQQILEEYKPHKYSPKHNFSGKTECFQQSTNLINRMKKTVEIHIR